MPFQGSRGERADVGLDIEAAGIECDAIDPEAADDVAQTSTAPAQQTADPLAGVGGLGGAGVVCGR